MIEERAPIVPNLANQINFLHVNIRYLLTVQDSVVSSLCYVIKNLIHISDVEVIGQPQHYEAATSKVEVPHAAIYVLLLT